MKAGDKFRNNFSGNEGTIFEVGFKGVGVGYNSPAYSDIAPENYAAHWLDADKVVVIPEFTQVPGGPTNQVVEHHPTFPPGTRAVHKYNSSGPGYVSSGVRTFGTSVRFIPDSDPRKEYSVFVDFLNHEAKAPEIKAPDVVSIEDLYSEGFKSVPNEDHKDVPPQIAAQDTRTNQLLNELYHDRARLEKVVDDGVDVIDTLMKVIECTRTGDDQDDDGALTDEEYIAWAYGLGQQFTETHGDQE